MTRQQEYLNIYLKINAAETLEKQGDFRGALDDFKDCYTRLQRIHTIDPDWERALVIKRLEDCRSKIDELTPKAAAQAPAVPPTLNINSTNPDQGSVSPATPTTAGSGDDVAALKQQLADVRQRLTDMKVKYDAMEAKYTAAAAEAQNLHSQLDAVNQQLDSLKGQQTVDDKMAKLLSQNTALSTKLTAAQKELDGYKTNPKTKLAKAMVQLKSMTDQLAAAQAQNTALQQTATTLKDQLDQAQHDLAVASNKLATSGVAGTPEYENLKRENEMMRDILTRELQEQAHRDMAKRLYQEEFDRLKINSKVLQEQVDILSSPMTPPTNDQERALLANLRVSGGDVSVPAAPSNSNDFSAPAAGATPAAGGTTGATPAPDTNAAPAAITPPTTDNSTSSTTNAPAVTTTTDNGAVTTTSNTPAPGTPPSPSTPDANAASATSVTTPAPSVSTTSNSAPVTTTTDNGSVTTTSNTPPAPSTPDVTSSNSSSVTAPMTPPTEVPPTVSSSNSSTATNVPTVPVPSSPPDTGATTNAPTVTQLPPAQTTYTDTTVQHGNDRTPDPTQFSTKPRLPDDMRDTAQQAADLFKMQRYDEAADKYQTIIDKYPESLYAWSNLGVVRFQQGNYDQALKALQQAVKLSPTDAFSYSNLGIVYYQMGQYENAISALERALALDPNDAKSHNYLGCACSQKGWQEVAEREFLKAIALDDNFGDAHFNLALVYATSKPPSLELARRHYKRAQELGIAQDPRLEKLLQQ